MTTSVWTTKREGVADALKTALEATAARWSVAAGPVDSPPSMPCAIIGPDEPYRQPLDFGQQAQEMRLIVHLFLNRATGNHALDIFDEAADACLGALDAVSFSVAWSALRLTGEVDLNGQPALGASFQLSVL